jgi:hypothetical protein
MELKVPSSFGSEFPRRFLKFPDPKINVTLQDFELFAAVLLITVFWDVTKLPSFRRIRFAFICRVKQKKRNILYRL